MKLIKEIKNIQLSVIFASLLLIIFGLFFLKPYANDKIRIGAEIAKSFKNNQTGYVVNLVCSPNGHLSNWAEEPPIFHIINSIFTIPFDGDIYYKSAGIFLILVLFLSLILTTKQLKKRPLDIFDVFAPLSFPMIFLYLGRPLPDTLSTIFVVLFIYSVIKKFTHFSLMFGILAVSTKILAIFPIFFFSFTYLIFTKKSIKKIFVFCVSTPWFAFYLP